MFADQLGFFTTCLFKSFALFVSWAVCLLPIDFSFFLNDKFYSKRGPVVPETLM